MKLVHRLSPLLSRVSARLGHPNDYHQTARRSWELSPSVVAQSRPALFEPDDLAKITGVYPGNTVEQEVSRARGGPVPHGATTVYEFEDVVLTAGHLFTRRMSLSASTGKPPLVATGALPDFDQAVLASTKLGVTFFGHWMHDDLPLALAARELGRPVSTLAAPTPSQTAYGAILDIRPEVVTDGFFRRMHVLDDNGQNDSKRERYLQMRALAMRSARPRRPPGVMLLRGATGARRQLVNEAEVADLLRARGWLVLDPARVPASEVLDACAEVPLLLGVEGSQMSNGLLWMALRGTMVIIQPPQRFVTVLKNPCDTLGIGYAFIVADPREQDCFHVDTTALLKLLDRVEQDVGRRMAAA